MTRSDSNPPVLLFPTKYLGNMVLGLPWIRSALAEHPRALVVIDGRFEPLARMALDPGARLLLYPRRLLARDQSLGARFRHYRRFVGALRGGGRGGCLVDMEGERFSGLLSLLSGCGRRIGPAGRRAGRFYTEPRELNYRNHRIGAYGELLRGIAGPERPSNRLPYRIGEDAVRAVRERLGGRADRPLAAIHPGASASYKQWPRECFAELAGMLGEAGYQVVWTGYGKSDEAIIAGIMKRLGGVGAVDLCGLDFAEQAALFRMCRLFVGGDSGPMHFAASAGLPVYALFGPSDAAIWAPLGEESRLLRGAEPCGDGCDAHRCDHGYRCLKSLRPEAVAGAIREGAA